jgi:hypothetical protein
VLIPRPEGPTSQSDSTELAEVLRRGWLFGVTYHNMRARHSVATAAWAIVSDRFAVLGVARNAQVPGREPLSILVLTDFRGGASACPVTGSVASTVRGSEFRGLSF